MPPISQPSARAGTSTQFTGNYRGPLMVLTSLFFIWAFVTNLNDILIPQLKKACNLTDFQSSLVQSAFFGAYFIMSLPAGAIIKRVGYKKGIIVGLAFMLVGALLFLPAAMTRAYSIFLAALFILASGVTILQVAANPFVSVLGKPETASNRLNLTQAFNSLGASLAPLIGGALIFSGVELSDTQLAAMPFAEQEAYRIAEASSVIGPYLGLAFVILLLIALIHFSKLPEIDDELEREEDDYLSSPHEAKTSVWQYSHLVAGVIAIFFYVGAEVAIASFLIRFAGLPEVAGLPEMEAKNFTSAYMFCAMVGRFLGSAFLDKLGPNKVVTFNGIAAIALISIAMFFGGELALYALVLVGLFNSIMFPTIFTLAIRDLGKFTKAGSSLLIMAIVGGAIIPPLTGLAFDFLRDANASLVYAFTVPAVSYLAIVYFGAKGYKVK